MPNTTYLAKSRITHCLKCPTKIYYKNHEDEYTTSQDDDDFLKALAEGGIQVRSGYQNWESLGESG